MASFLRHIASDRVRQWLPLATLILLIVIVGTLEPVFLQPATLLDLAGDTAVLFILASGVTFVIMLGGIDLSLQSMASLSSVIVALTLPRLGYAAFPAAIAAGALAGLLAGLAHTRLRIPSFIATLAMGGVLASTALVSSGERSITLGADDRGYLGWITGTLAGIPNVVIIGLVVLVVAHILQAHTRFGRYSAAIGAGEPATYASGVKVNRQKVIAFVLSGGFAALAGIILTGRLASGSPTLAAEMLLPAIAAVVVGGTAITGGVGSIWRTLVGALIISVVRIGMTFLGVNIFAQNIVFGAVLVLAVAITIDRSKIPIVK
ncbi:ribose transport system permease protein [Amaricoccus macauensis]|uniref:Ribose transport system permease protein n=1 Tax=Amaricoccus macauensis TaxID=57001 RepID=A0A840SRL1_9RHOB|nr:ABC transporter permease [Amaricoccus macauensis]MBB5221852.1 ribose transport system permease protein [Amaricoccus macauensis]